MDRLHYRRACLAPNPWLFPPMGQHLPAHMVVRRQEHGESQPAGFVARGGQFLVPLPRPMLVS